MSDGAIARPRFQTRPSSTRDFLTGLLSPLYAVRFLLSRPALWRYTLVGAAVTALVFGGFVTLAISHMDTVANALWARPETTASSVLWWVLAILSGAVLIGVAGVAALLVSQIVMAPLNSKLSERTEDLIFGRVEHEETLLGSVWDELRGVGHSVVTLVLFGVVMAFVVLMNLVPFFGSIAAPLIGCVVSAFALAFEFCDNPLSRRKAGWREKWRQAVGELPSTIGLGAGVGLMLLIPLVDFFLVPVAVVAGTMVFCGLHEAGRVQVPDRRVLKEDPNLARLE